MSPHPGTFYKHAIQQLEQRHLGITANVSPRYHHAGRTGHPFPGYGVGGCQEALISHGIPPNCAEHCCWIREDLQPCCSMGASMPGPLHNSSRCSVQACAGHGWQHPWLYAFIQSNEVLSHAPLSSVGHISTMTDGAPSMDACGQLHQLQVPKLLQYKDLVVCAEGINGQVEALQFTFKELPFWNATTPGQPACKLQLMVVDLSSMQSEGITAAV